MAILFPVKREMAILFFVKRDLEPPFTTLFFYIIRNDLLLNITKDITDRILEQRVFDQWHHDDNIHLRKLGEQVLGHMATFENLHHFRSWVNNMAKSTKIVVFE